MDILLTICITWIIAQLVGMAANNESWKSNADKPEGIQSRDGYTYYITKKPTSSLRQ